MLIKKVYNTTNILIFTECYITIPEVGHFILKYWSQNHLYHKHWDFEDKILKMINKTFHILKLMLFSSRNNPHSIKEFTLHSLSGSPPSPITISLHNILIIKVLREKKVGGQILIFLTSEVGLDHKVFRKPQSFQLK